MTIVVAFSIFETAPASGQSFIAHAMPTILLVVGLNLSVTILSTLRDWTFSIRHPSIYRRISEFLTAYVHSQSMAFWTGRMAGQGHFFFTFRTRMIQ